MYVLTWPDITSRLGVRYLLAHAHGNLMALHACATVDIAVARMRDQIDARSLVCSYLSDSANVTGEKPGEFGAMFG